MRGQHYGDTAEGQPSFACALTNQHPWHSIIINATPDYRG